MGVLERHDAWAAVDFARSHHPSEALAVIGVSLGGAAALLTSPLDIAALIVESVYSTIEAAIRNRVGKALGAFEAVPSALLLAQVQWRLGARCEELRPIDAIVDAQCPIFLISGSEDRYTTADETRDLFSAAREPKELWIVEGAEHENLMNFAPDDYARRILDFLDRYMLRDR